MNINEFYKTYEEPEVIDERIKNIISTIVVSKGKGFNKEIEKQLEEQKNYFFKTFNDVVMTPELEATFPIWVFDNIEKVTDYNDYNSKLIIDESLDNIVEDDNIKLHWRVSYYDKDKNIWSGTKPRDIAYRILEIIFEY